MSKWSPMVNVMCILSLFFWDWFTGEHDIVYPEDIK